MADFEAIPDFQFVTEKKYDTLITQFENGVEQRRARRSNPIQEFTLQFRNRPQADLDEVVTLFDTSKGSLSAFTWLNPEDATEYTVRFKEDSFKKMLKHYGIFDFEFTLVTVL